MELRAEAAIHASRIEAQPKPRLCQVDVGTAAVAAPTTCGEKLIPIDDWTDLCPVHGEMH